MTSSRSPEPSDPYRSRTISDGAYTAWKGPFSSRERADRFLESRAMKLFSGWGRVGQLILWIHILQWAPWIHIQRQSRQLKHCPWNIPGLSGCAGGSVLKCARDCFTVCVFFEAWFNVWLFHFLWRFMWCYACIICYTHLAKEYKHTLFVWECPKPDIVSCRFGVRKMRLQMKQRQKIFELFYHSKTESMICIGLVQKYNLLDGFYFISNEENSHQP